MATEVAQVGGESHGSIAWSLLSHYHVPGLNWVIWATLLAMLFAIAAAVASLIAPRRLRNSGLVLGQALTPLGPLLGLLGAAMVMHQMAIHQIDGDPRAFDGEQAVATGVATMTLMFGLIAGIVGVVLTTLLRIVHRDDKSDQPRAT